MRLINPNLLYFVGSFTEELKNMLFVMYKIGDKTIRYCESLNKLNKEVVKYKEYPKAVFFLPEKGADMKVFSRLSRNNRQSYFLAIILEEDLWPFTRGENCDMILLKNLNRIPRGQFFL